MAPAGKLYQQVMARLHHLALARDARPSAGVPRGHFAVYVGEARKRFVIPTAYLRHPSFLLLLQRVEDEFGFDGHRATGGLTIPCSEGDFASIVGGCSPAPRGTSPPSPPSGSLASSSS